MLLNLWGKFEDMVNGQLNKVFGAVQSKLPPMPHITTSTKKSVPPDPVVKKEPEVKFDFKTELKKLVPVALSLVDVVKAPVINYINGIKGLNFKTAGIKNILMAIFAFVLEPLRFVKGLLSETKPAALLLYSSVIVGSAIALTLIFTLSKEFYERSQNSRSIASIHSLDLKRTSYYKLEEKHFILYNIYIPFDLEGNTKNMIIDFILTPSNVYIKEFITEKEYVLQDRLNTYFETVSKDFPLTEEGKSIIKEKVKEEANAMLKEWKLKGSIDDVQIHYIIAP